MNVELGRVAYADQAVAVLRYEARRARDVALVAGHGYSSSKQNLDGLCAFLASHGFAVYALDFPGHKLGASGGRLRDAEDLVGPMQAVAARAREDGHRIVYALGHSMGAATALCAAAEEPTLAGAVAIATGLGRPQALDGLAARGVVDLRSSYVDGLALPDAAALWAPRLERALPRLGGRPVLVVAATRDAMVARSAVRALAERIDGAAYAEVESDHTFAADNSRGAVLAWLNERHPRRAAATVATPLLDAPL